MPQDERPTPEQMFERFVEQERREQEALKQQMIERAQEAGSLPPPTPEPEPD